ncbi:lactonase drp35 [Staphylococcus aureus]|nr:lactonase drp35 [Staphylococcus aureus]
MQRQKMVNNIQDIIEDLSTEYCIDDMVFDSKGGFYFTDFRGYSTNPLGGVYYVTPDFKTVTPIIQNISVANGIALSTDEKVLWVTETTANRLHRIALEDDWCDDTTIWGNNSVLFYGA